MLLLTFVALLALAPQSSYLVVLDERVPPAQAQAWRDAAHELAGAHAGDVVSWNGDWSALEKILKERTPADLALVMPPDRIDANLPRILVPILTRLDDDPFVDCRFGIITGATGDDALRFVRNIRRAASSATPTRSVSITAVTVDKCLLIPRAQQGLAIDRKGDEAQLWITATDKGFREFVAAHRAEMQGAGFIEWGHCGDSQGIWLFNPNRNRDASKHWPYDPAKVGNDPNNEMPRLTPALLMEGVDLFPAVVVNGSCHSGVTHNTVVQGDIVSTFGDTGGVARFCPIKAEESFPLQAIGHGAVAYIAPLAANNANRAAIEEWMIREGGRSLGEVMRRTYDELVMGAGSTNSERTLIFPPFKEGETPPHRPPMFDDTVHRVLFGDPAYMPWKDRAATSHGVGTTLTDDGLHVSIEWKDLKRDPWVWDPWREDSTRGAAERGRVLERVVLPRGVAVTGAPSVNVLRAEARRGDQRTPLSLDVVCLVDHTPDGRDELVIKASGLREAMDARGLKNGPDSLALEVQVVFAGK